MNQPANSTPTTPWYKERWFWFVAGILMVGVAGPLTMVGIALNNADTVVKDDWYKDGKEINMSLHRDTKARELGLVATITLDHVTGEATVALSAPAGSEGDIPTLHITHPTRENQDVVIPLRRVDQGKWRGDVSAEIQGKRYVELGNKDWRLTGVIQFPQSQAFELKPK